MQLYLAHVGYREDVMGIDELHTHFLIAATDIKDAKEKVMAKKIFQDKKMHIDGMIEIKNIDGYDIHLSAAAADGENKTYSGSDLRKMS